MTTSVGEPKLITPADLNTERQVSLVKTSQTLARRPAEHKTGRCPN